MDPIERKFNERPDDTRFRRTYERDSRDIREKPRPMNTVENFREDRFQRGRDIREGRNGLERREDQRDNKRNGKQEVDKTTVDRDTSFDYLVPKSNRYFQHDNREEGPTRQPRGRNRGRSFRMDRYIPRRMSPEKGEWRHDRFETPNTLKQNGQETIEDPIPNPKERKK